MSRMRCSDTGLSTTTTSSGLLDDARTRPQLPSSTVTRTPLTVTRSRIGCPATFPPLFWIASKCFTTESTIPYLASSAPCAAGTSFPHGVFQVRHRLAGRAIEHLANRDRRDQAIIITAAERRVEE